MRATIAIPSGTRMRALPVRPGTKATATPMSAQHQMDQTNPYPSLPSTKPTSNEPIIEATTNPFPSIPSHRLDLLTPLPPATMELPPQMEAQNVDLKKTINLPKTDFSMK